MAYQPSSSAKAGAPIFMNPAQFMQNAPVAPPGPPQMGPVPSNDQSRGAPGAPAPMMGYNPAQFNDAAAPPSQFPATAPFPQQEIPLSQGVQSDHFPAQDHHYNWNQGYDGYGYGYYNGTVAADQQYGYRPSQEGSAESQEQQNRQQTGAASTSGPPDLVSPAAVQPENEPSRWPAVDTDVPVPSFPETGYLPAAPPMTNGSCKTGPDITAIASTPSSADDQVQPPPFNPFPVSEGSVPKEAFQNQEVEDTAVHQPQGSHAEHYAYYQQFEHNNLAACNADEELGPPPSLPPLTVSLPASSQPNGPDVTAVTTLQQSEGPLQPPHEDASPDPGWVAAEAQHHHGTHAEHYAYYQQFEQNHRQEERQDEEDSASTRPPDILSGEPGISGAPSSDRNLFMQTGELREEGENLRQPVDGGNDQEDAVAASLDVDLPLDRLVLGESEQQRLSTGGGRVVAGSSTNEPPSARIIPGNNGHPPSNSLPAVTDGQPPQMQERSEAVGSDRRDQSVMGPPPSGPVPSGRRDVTGSSEPAPNQGGRRRNKRETDQRSDQEDARNDRRERNYDEGGDSSSKESSRKHYGKNDQRRGNRRRRNDRRDESRSSSEHSEESDRESGRKGGGGRRYNKHNESRGNRRYDDRYRGDHDSSRRHNRESKRRSYDDRKYRNEREGSYYHRNDREDSSYVDESVSSRRNYRNRREIDGSFYGNDSRPSSRGASEAHSYRYDNYHPRYPPPHFRGYPGYPPPHPQMQQQVAPASLDEEKLNVFRRNWEYYSRNPKEMDALRLNNPAKHDTLMRYYQKYSHLLPASGSGDQGRFSRRGSVGSAQSSMPGGASASAVPNVSILNAEGTGTGGVMSISSSTTGLGGTTFQEHFHYNLKQNSAQVNEESSIYPDPDAVDPYQPTLEGQQAFDRCDAEVETIAENNVFEKDHVATASLRMTPVKFSIPHVKGVFGPRGTVAKIDAKSPLDGQSATVELHSLQLLMSGQPDFQDLLKFPGPLLPGRTHKGEVIQFCQSKIQGALRSASIVDKDSYILLWELLILLLRQKNAIDGSDIAELLLKDRADVRRPYTMHQPELQQPEGDALENSDREKDGAGSRTSQERSVICSTAAEEEEKHTVKFRDYLLFGHKKEGLEYAMRHGLWGHALFLASKMDERSYSKVMLRFANGLAVNDPLQTLYQSMSGRQPIAVKECADSNWGDWRPHLAMILSNPSGKEGLDARSIRTLGDSLVERGFLYAAQFCYLMANVEFGTYANPATKMVLLMGDMGLPSFDAFASNEAIQATEILEYAQKLSNPDHVMVSLQYFKFIYAIRLMDHGMSYEAYHYLEELSSCIVRRPVDYVGNVGMDGPTMVTQIFSLAEQMKFLDPMYTTREGEVAEMGDPGWLDSLRSAAHQICSYGYEASGTDGYGADGDVDQPALHRTDVVPDDCHSNGEVQQHVQSVHPSHQDEAKAHEENASAVPMFTPQDALLPPPPAVMNVPLQPPNNAFVQPPAPVERPPDSPSHSVGGQGKDGFFAGAAAPTAGAKAAHVTPQPQPKEAVKKGGSGIKGDQPTKRSKGIFGKIFGGFFKQPNQMILPDDKDNTIVWDGEKKRWVDKNAGLDDETRKLAPPPLMKDLGGGGPKPAIPSGGNAYAGGLGKRKGLSGRVDVFRSSMSAPSLAPSSEQMPPPGSLAAPTPPMEPAGLMVPAPIAEEAEETAPGDQADAVGASAPVFFNPNQFVGSVAPTRRNKYT